MVSPEVPAEDSIAQVHKPNLFVCVPLGVTPPCDCDPPCMTELARGKHQQKSKDDEGDAKKKKTPFCYGALCFLSLVSFSTLAVVATVAFAQVR